MADWHIYTTAQTQAEALAQAVAQALGQTIAERGRAVIALSGGRSPVVFLQRLQTLPLPWRQITVTLADERVVPPDHPQSNARLLREHLLQGAAADAQFIPLIEHPGQPERDLQRLQRDLPPLDIVVLGMGEDGHTASLFPGAVGVAEALSADCPQTAMLFHPAQTAEPRLSLTWSALTAAEVLFLSIQGEGKRQVAQRDDPALPISRFMRLGTLQVYWAAE